MPIVGEPILGESKRCSRCKRVFPLSKFRFMRKQNRYYSYCESCDSLQQKEKHQRRKTRLNYPPAKKKFCPTCKRTKVGNYFYRNPLSKNGLGYECKGCNGRRKNLRPKPGPILNPIPVPDGRKRCYACKIIKPVSEFHRNRRRPDYLEVYCKACSIPLRMDGYFRHKYGITLVEYETMCTQQGNLCIICKQKETHIHLGRVSRLSVDHDHTSKVPNTRGIVCNRCNHALSGLEVLMRAGLVQVALEYLQSHGVPYSG